MCGKVVFGCEGTHSDPVASLGDSNVRRWVKTGERMESGRKGHFWVLLQALESNSLEGQTFGRCGWLFDPIGRKSGGKLYSAIKVHILSRLQVRTIEM